MITRLNHPDTAYEWQIQSSLFAEIPKEISSYINLLPKALEKVWPLKAVHKKSLPADIYSLSQNLTCQRSNLKRPYWSKPGWISAYLYYFLPWNLIRLTRLIYNLKIDAPLFDNNRLPLLCDTGSGPLTFPLAIWLAKPKWRNLPVTILAMDSNKIPLDLGTKILMNMGEILQFPVWKVIKIKTSLESLSKYAAQIIKHENKFYPWLITSSNTLNELSISKSRRNKQYDCFSKLDNENSENDDCAIQSTQIDRKLSKLLEAWRPLWEKSADHKSAPILFVEPGTRYGGSILMHLRKIALKNGLHAMSPCDHDKKCPLLQTDSDGHGSFSNSWCHFTFLVDNAPNWLKQLSYQAGLTKKTLSLSVLFLRNEPSLSSKKQKAISCRIVSNPFKINYPVDGFGRYACSSIGLSLLPDTQNLNSGDVVLAQIQTNDIRDPKSSAKVLKPFLKCK